MNKMTKLKDPTEMTDDELKELEEVIVRNQQNFGIDPIFETALKMTCPNCNHKQVCPCESCNNPLDLKPWVWQDDGNSVACGNCGVVKSADEWMDLEMEQYQKLKGSTTNDR